MHSHRWSEQGHLGVILFISQQKKKKKRKKRKKKKQKKRKARQSETVDRRATETNLYFALWT